MITHHFRMKRWPARVLTLAAISLAMLLGGCRQDAIPWQLIEVTGHMPDLKLQLTDDSGKAVSAADYRGKVVLLYFGYTHCPDVCPLTMAHLHVVMQRLGALADGARILFVSVDPARDTPALLHDYVTQFDPHATGLTGSAQAIESLSKRYRSAFTREPDAADGAYEVSHSSAIYIFDRDGKARLLATPSNTPDQLVHDLYLLLSQGDKP